MRFIHTLLLLLVAFFIPNVYAEQKQPPLVFVVPYPAGGDMDIIARIFATEYTEKTGRTTVVENKPGAAGVIGFMYLAKANNDGNIIGMVPSTLTTAPYFNPKAAKYDPKTDFVPILQVTSHSMHISVNADSGVKTINDLIEANKSGKITAYGTPGVASPQNIFGEVFKKATNTNMIHVPFKGNAEVVNSFVNNTIQMTFNTSLPMQSFIDSGKINVIASTGSKRSTTYPNVPTLSEQGIRGLDFESWAGFVGPKGMNPKIANDLNSVFIEIMKQPEVQDKLRKLSMTPTMTTPSSFKDKIQRDSDKFQRIAKEIDIKIE